MNTLNINHKQAFFLAAMAVASFLPASKSYAQEALKEETIDIISTNQPKLRDAYKLNLTASLPSVDTSRPVLKYQIPALNLNFMYQATQLKPLALGKDSLGNLQNNFLKLGYGNLQTPYVQAGFGSGRHEQYNYGLYVNYTGSKDSKIEDQQYSNLNVLASGAYLTSKLKFDASLGYDRNTVHYYGYDHDTANYKNKDLAQTFNQVTAAVGVQNRPQNDWAFTFQPEVKFVLFNDSYKRTENTFIFKAPLRKQIFEDIYIGVEGIFDLSTYKPETGRTVNNNIVAIHPAVDIIKPGFVLHAGVNPTWTNNKFKLLPDIVNESHLIKKKLILSSGWISYFEKNSYRNLANKNPFLAGLADDMLNTRVEEKYTGIKGTLGSHFNYNTKFASVIWYDQPLFINDTLDTKKFITVNETMLKAFQLHAEIGYIEEEKFQARLSFDWYNYTKQETQLKPWHLPPFQGDLYAQYTIGRKFHLKADIFALSGTYYLLPNKDFNKTQGAWDLNAGAAYDIGKNFGLWVNANNIFNSHYQRYYLYPTYGFNIVGGVQIKF